MNPSESLYLTAHAQSIIGTANCGAELLDAIPRIGERLVEIGWRLSSPDEGGDVEASSSLCCFAFAADEGDARRSIIRLSRLLDVHAGHLRLLNCLIQAWECAERMDTICSGLTVRWSRKDALSLSGEAHPKVVRLRPYGALSGGGR
jgi:hypothetical protein